MTLTDNQNIILSDKPPITTTMKSLPPALLEQLLTELSTLASVYHKPPETFVGAGRYGADAIQHAAIQEQRQNAVDNPIAAAAASNGVPVQNNAENLLDIDFDGAAPASTETMPPAGSDGLEGLGGTPQRLQTPAAGGAPVGSSMEDMMGLFDTHGPGSLQSPVDGSGNSMGGMDDLMGMNGFGGLDLNGGQAPPAQQQASGSKKTTEDLLGMF